MRHGVKWRANRCAKWLAIPPELLQPEQRLIVADRALYQAKMAGRNPIAVSDDMCCDASNVAHSIPTKAGLWSKSIETIEL
jgi:hypothetical protein